MNQRTHLELLRGTGNAGLSDIAQIYILNFYLGLIFSYSHLPLAFYNYMSFFCGFPEDTRTNISYDIPRTHLTFVLIGKDHVWAPKQVSIMF